MSTFDFDKIRQKAIKKPFFLLLIFIFAVTPALVFGFPGYSFLDMDDDFISHLYPDNNVGIFYFDIGNKTEILGGYSGLGSGLYIETGINPFVFMNKGLLIAPFIGISPVWGSDYKDSFQKNLSEHYRRCTEYEEILAELEAIIYEGGSLSADDQKKLDVFEYGDSLINTMMTDPMAGAWSWYYGIIFRLPFKYMPVIKAYIVNHYVSIVSSSTGWIKDGVAQSGSDGIWFSGLGADFVVFRGYTVMSEELLGQANLVSVSIFCEGLDLLDARFTKTYSDFWQDKSWEAPMFKDFLDPTFFEKNRFQLKAGIKIGFNLF